MFPLLPFRAPTPGISLNWQPQQQVIGNPMNSINATKYTFGNDQIAKLLGVPPWHNFGKAPSPAATGAAAKVAPGGVGEGVGKIAPEYASPVKWTGGGVGGSGVASGIHTGMGYSAGNSPYPGVGAGNVTIKPKSVIAQPVTTKKKKVM